MGYAVSHTSRQPRAGETDGVEYHFVDRQTFRKMIDAGAFVEWAEVYGNLYGTSQESLEREISRGLDLLLDIDTQGGGHIRQRFPQCVLVYIVPPSMEALEARLTARGTDDPGVIQRRMDKAAGEIRDCMRYDFIVVNDELEKAVSRVQAIITSTRAKRGRMLPEVRSRFPGVFEDSKDRG